MRLFVTFSSSELLTYLVILECSAAWASQLTLKHGFGITRSLEKKNAQLLTRFGRLRLEVNFLN